MAALFDGIDINGMALKNRAVRSATWTGMAEADGQYSTRLIKLLTDLASGEVGLIITGFAYVLPNGKALSGQAGIHSDAMIPRLKQLTEKIHNAAGKICMQIAHAGTQTMLRPKNDRPIWGPSPVYNKVFKSTPKPMTQAEIKQTVRAFALAAGRVKQAGFDAVQIHAAHGYLIGQFLSPATNRRTDKFGGSLENRTRFLFQITRAVRKAVGKDYPVLVKLNAKDFVRAGLTLADGLSVAKGLDALGVDAIEVSGGVPAAGPMGPARMKIRKADDEAYFATMAKKIKKQVSAPVMVVGGIRSFKRIDTILRAGHADLVSMSRPFIREPALIKRWKQGDRKKAACISCNQCFSTGLSRRGLHCAVKRQKEKRKK
ncbi:MAG: NADH:flavin oxidoreductase [Deltaproteobacteria bacterium]|nr:NADH:flavin oxidoreductase [Deltaproteobacteria bacterium]